MIPYGIASYGMVIRNTEKAKQTGVCLCLMAKHSSLSVDSNYTCKTGNIFETENFK